MVALTRAKNVALRPSLKTLTDLLHEFIACFIREANISYEYVKRFLGGKFQCDGGVPCSFNGIA
jgi:hypothetical protein